MLTASLSAQDQLAELMADAMPQQILAFKFSPDTQQRIEALVDKKKTGTLPADEQEELEKYLMYDLLIGLAKARAFQHLTPQ
jgi:hypothetical protein